MKTNVNILSKELCEVLYNEYNFDYEVLYTFIGDVLIKQPDWDLYRNYMPAPFLETVIQWLNECQKIELYVIPITNTDNKRLGYTFIYYNNENNTSSNSEISYNSYTNALYYGIMFMLKYYLKGKTDVAEFDKYMYETFSKSN